MGSQTNHDTLAAAPAAIVLREAAIGGGWRWRIAERVSAWQPDRSHGGMGPCVVTYSLTSGLPYRTEEAAQTDAALIVARDKDCWGPNGSR